MSITEKNMFDRKTILVCSAFLMIAAVAGGDKAFSVLFPLISLAVITAVGLPLVTFTANLAWLLVFQHLYNLIPQRFSSTRNTFRLFFAPPNKQKA